MKKLTVLLASLLVVALAVPVFAEDEWSFEIGRMRYRFDHEIAKLPDEIEYMDDDFDTTWIFKKGDITFSWELELADSTLGDDQVRQSDGWECVLGAYSAKWAPAEQSWWLAVGDFGTGFGKAINNDDSPHGSLEVGLTSGDMEFILGYGRVSEGDTDDDVEGDEHLLRGQFHMPLGENGFTIGAYVAAYLGQDLIFQEAIEATETEPAVPAVIDDRSVFLGAVEFSGSLDSIDLYSEVGFATGSEADVDLSGFYAMGGASFAVGPATLGIEAGFASGDDDPADDKDEGFTAINSDFWLGEIMHDEELITRTNGAGGGLSNLIYGLLTVDYDPTDKLSTYVGFLYLKPVEEIGGVDTYGMELYGGATYALADYLAYNLYWGYAIPDEDFIDDNLYQVVNRLEFAF